MPGRARKDNTPTAADAKLSAYHAKRDFAKTAEPAGSESVRSESGRLYVIQKHAARRLHYDFRLELDGVLKSWAVPKGPSLDPQQKPLAVQTEDHPIEYGDFEGIIPKGEYGGGTVMVWDRGVWEPIGDPHDGLAKGDLKFILHGEKLGGEFVLARMSGKGNESGRNWLLIKKKDNAARPIGEYNVLGEASRSALTGRALDEIEADSDLVWKDGAAQTPKQPRRSAKRTSHAGLPPRFDALALSGAREGGTPESISPQLALSAAHAPDGDEWIHEIKLDGYRLLSFIDDGAARIFTRNGNDWTDRFGSIVRALVRMPIQNGVIDGEVVILDEDGIANFQLLQNAFRSRSATSGASFVYFVFDLLFLNGVDLRGCALLDRKSVLKRVIDASPGLGEASVVRYCDHIQGRGPIVLAEAARAGLEGIVSKRAASKYLSKRSDNWLKVKCTTRQEFVVGGFTDPSGSRSGFGALLLGCYNDIGDLIYHGRVGTGFSDGLLDALTARLREIEVKSPPFANPEKDPDARKAHWVAPEIVVEVEFSNWTHEDLIRHPAFRGVREDKNPRDVHRDLPAPSPEKPPAPQAKVVNIVKSPRSPMDAVVAGVRISNPERTVYPDDGVTKKEVAEYYAAIAEHMLPFVKGRPLAIVRCPLGLAGDSFYQRELGQGWPEAIRGVRIGDDHAIVVDDAQGLVSLAQMGVLELHAWQCREDQTDKPDQLVFDLDPGPGIEWEHIVAAAGFVRNYLDSIGLQSFVKTSGGSGVHLLVPIVRRSDWEEAKTFSLHIARELARLAPMNFVATMTKALRTHRIYVDYLRNQEAATSVAVFSTRAKSGATVSTPLAWDELSSGLTPRDLTIRTVLPRVADGGHQLWQGYFDLRQSITRTMKRTVGMSE